MKKVITYLLIVCLCLGTCGLCWNYIQNKNVILKQEINSENIEIIEEKEDTTNVKNIDEYITLEKENNSNIVKEYISKGLNIEELNDIINRKFENIFIKNKYENVYYDFEKHYTYSELETLYKYLSLSDIVNLNVIGKSIDNRNIYSLEIGKGENVIMFEANIHAAEIANTLFVTKLAVDLVNNYENKNEEIMNLLNNVKILIVPTINPDGYDYSLFGKYIIKNSNLFTYKNDDKINRTIVKFNMNGVDLNRNFPSQTGGLYFSNKHYSVAKDYTTDVTKYFSGESLASESETKALMSWIYNNYQNAYAYVSLHNAGRVIYNGKANLSDEFNYLSKECANIVNKYTGYTVYEPETDNGLGTDGTSTDFIAELIHNYKISTQTGRLSTYKYNDKVNELNNNICVLTIESMKSYSFDLNVIKEEWYNTNLKEALFALIKNYE